MMQVGTGLSCKARLGEGEMVKPLHLRAARRGRLIAWVCTTAQGAQRSRCRQGPLCWLFVLAFRGLRHLHRISPSC